MFASSLSKSKTNEELFLITGLVAASTMGCKKKDATSTEDKPEFRNRSNAESFVSIAPAFSSISAYTLISSSDTIPVYPNFVFGGAPDGQGFLKNPDGSGYIMVTNHENTYAVSRVYLDKKLNPVKGEYIVNTAGGMYPEGKLCKLPQTRNVFYRRERKSGEFYSWRQTQQKYAYNFVCRFSE